MNAVGAASVRAMLPATEKIVRCNALSHEVGVVL